MKNILSMLSLLLICDVSLAQIYTCLCYKDIDGVETQFHFVIVTDPEKGLETCQEDDPATTKAACAEEEGQ